MLNKQINILIVIPARGGSKSIPRKNLRLLNGKPLIYYSIKTALSSRFNADIYVSSDDDEILITAKLFGALPHKRDARIADDKSTLDPVIYSCYEFAMQENCKSYDLIITMQPTSPLLKTSSLDSAIQQAIDNFKTDTIIAAKDTTSLTWRKEDNKYLPNYKKRLNRQDLTPNYTETGAFLITRKSVISPTNRIGDHVDLYLLSDGEEIDIDTFDDWNICEYKLKRKTILFVVTGNKIVGLGHVYNTLLLANDILDHDVLFLVDDTSQLAFDKIAEKNYTVLKQKNQNIVEDIVSINPDVVINDILDTSKEYVSELRNKGYKVINFEDLGEGSKEAGLVFNAIYPNKGIKPNHYFGADYFVLRDEFIYSKTKKINKNVESVLITFGGVDPNNYTLKVIKTIYDYCQEKNIKISVIAGFGYNKYKTLEKFNNITIYKDISNISEYMLQSDLIFTSAGRTTYEIASLGIPAIVLAQNERELTHFFANNEYGFLNLGLGYKLKPEELRINFLDICNSFDSRVHMNKQMLKIDLKSGRSKVIKLIKEFIGS